MGRRPWLLLMCLPDPELVTMIVTDEVETVHGSPVDYGGDCDDSDYKDIRNEFVTEDGVPACCTPSSYSVICVDELTLIELVG